MECCVLDSYCNFAKSEEMMLPDTPLDGSCFSHVRGAGIERRAENYYRVDRFYLWSKGNASVSQVSP